MKNAISTEVGEIMDAVNYRPAISIILPFEPKMNARLEINQRLKFATDKVEKEIRRDYPSDIAGIVMQKLRTIIKDLNFNTYKKSIAIYVSPVFEKVLYLDIPVNERIVVDQSFEVRDLVCAKKETREYMVVMLSGQRSKVYAANVNSFRQIKSNVPSDITQFENDVPEKVANFTDSLARNETMLKKFLHQVDTELSLLLNTSRLPVFVIGPVKVLGYFKSLTKNDKNIISYIYGNYEEATETDLIGVLNPYVSYWKKVIQQNIKLQMEKAAGAGKLVSGVRQVWKKATQHVGQLLIVEKNFVYPAQAGSNGEVIYMPVEPYNKFSHIKDAVDDIIEKVLVDGGDVEFVDDGALADHQGIAMILRY